MAQMPVEREERIFKCFQINPQKHLYGFKLKNKKSC